MSAHNAAHQPDPVGETPPGTRPRHRGRWIAGVPSVALLAGFAVRLATFGTPGSAAVRPTARTTSSSGASKAAGNSASAATSLAPNGVFTTLDAGAAVVAKLRGKDMTVTVLRGKPVLLWFLVTSCSTCAASAPVIAKALPSLEADGVHVVGLDLYGDIRPTSQGWGQLAAWAANNAGPAWSSSEWTWGMASKALSLAYDPSGNPDVYFLIGPRGHLRYQDSVPVSTMGQLLAAAAHMTGHTVSADPPASPTSTTGPTLP